MSSPTLCRERLNRILNVLDRNAGTLPARAFTRSYSVWQWEIKAAAALGWVEIVTRKPPVGRPSRCVRRVSQTVTAKLPPYRWQMDKPIPRKYQIFAISTVHTTPGLCRFLTTHGHRVPYITDTYQELYPRAQNRKAASASACRLKRRLEVRMSQVWIKAYLNGEMPIGEPMPETTNAIRQRLHELGSLRVTRR